MIRQLMLLAKLMLLLSEYTKILESKSLSSTELQIHTSSGRHGNEGNNPLLWNLGANNTNEHNSDNNSNNSDNNNSDNNNSDNNNKHNNSHNNNNYNNNKHNNSQNNNNDHNNNKNNNNNNNNNINNNNNNSNLVLWHANLLNTSSAYKFVLGLESSIERSVPQGATVQLTCRFIRPVWYRDEKKLSLSNRTLLLQVARAQDGGRYSCYTPTGLHGMQWSNLTLTVISPDRAASHVENDIADFRQVEDPLFSHLSEDQLVDPMFELEFVTTVEPVSFLAAEAIVGTNLEEGSVTSVANFENFDASAPKFKQSSKLLTLLHRFENSLLQLSCPAGGNPLPEINWLHNGTVLDFNALNQRYKMKKWSLLIDELKSNDAGAYKCVLCNRYGCIEHSTQVIVEERVRMEPVMKEHTPRNVTVHVHENAQFECRVVSYLEPHIIWLRHMQRDKSIEEMVAPLRAHRHIVSDGQVLKLPTNEDDPQILRLGDVQLEDEGWYSCIAANTVGQSVASAYLKVVMPSVAHVSDAELRVDAENVSSVDKETDADSFVKVSSRPKLAKVAARPKDSEPEIESTHVEHNDADGDNKETDAAEAEESAPVFKKSDKMVNFIHKPSGSSVQLICNANGSPAPNITWTRNNTEIMRHIGKVIYKKWSMQMEDVITADSGVYKCSVCNKFGCIEHTTKLTVNDRLRTRPILSDKFPQNQTVLTNSSATFECRVVSDLEPFILWIKYTHRNETIRDLEKMAPIVSNTSRSESLNFMRLPTDPDNSHVLRLENVTHADEGWYTCIAANALGQSLASAYLRVVDKLPSREVYSLLRSQPMWITVVASIVLVLFLLGTVFFIFVLRKLKHEKLLKHRIETVHQWTKKVIIYKPASCEGSASDLLVPVIKIEKQRTTFEATANMDPTQGFNEYEFPLDSNWEIPRTQLALGSTLGEGAFGRVVMAEACGLPRTVTNSVTSSTIVAVKMVKEEHTDADMASLVREMEVMKMIGKHINIINLLGCCTQNGPLWVIVEFAPHGNLKDFLKKNRPLFVGSPSLQRNSCYLEEKPDPLLTEKNLISFAFQIARGMEYLASRRCIHRDLAARNVLVSDDYVMKIADFGLARDIQDTDYYRKNTNGRLPIKWMAPESLQEKFYDSQSDVWSFGVLLWEIMTYGEQPYPNIMSAEELYSYLITGQRMEKPQRCSLNIYMLMRQCWHFDANARPTFVEIVENLEKILQLTNTLANEDYLDLSMPMLETPPSSSDEDSEPETFQETSPLRYQYTYKFN